MTKYYICVDNQGGLCDRLCKGQSGVIANAKATLDTWIENQVIENYDEVLKNGKLDFLSAISILTTDNYEVEEFKSGDVHILDDNAIITDKKIDLHTKNDKFLVFNPFEVEYNEENLFSIY